MLDYQAKWVRDRSRLKLMEKSRQIGMTWASAYEIVTTTSLVDAQFDEWITSRDEIQARLFLDDCKAFARLLNIGAEYLGEKILDDKGNSAQVLQFANGRRANSMSSNPDAQAGKRGGRKIDEFGLHKDPRKLWAIAYPGITWGGSLAAWSTHRGSATFFNELIQEVKHKGNPKGISLHTVTLQDALDAGLLYKLQLKLPADDARMAMDEADYFDFIKAGCADEESFLQEFMCVPADDAGAFLSYELIDGIKYKPTERWEYTMAELAACKNPLYLGGDIGRVKDLTCFWVNEHLGGVHFTRKLVKLQNCTFEAQEHALYELLALPSMRRACIDNTGIGRQLVERAQARFGTYKVEAVTFTGAVKEELAYPARAAAEDKSARIPDDRTITAAFRSIRKETTAAGNIRFVAERNESGHADEFWAWALSLHAAKTSGTPGNFHRFGPTQASRARSSRRERTILA
jgi:phage FluMu gp28-like protein